MSKVTVIVTAETQNIFRYREVEALSNSFPSQNDKSFKLKKGLSEIMQSILLISQ
jgi:hypothetical protein